MLTNYYTSKTFFYLKISSSKMIHQVIGLPDLHSENCYSRMTGNHWSETIPFFILNENSNKLNENSNKLNENSNKLNENSNKLNENSNILHENSNKLNENSNKLNENSKKLKENFF